MKTQAAVALAPHEEFVIREVELGDPRPDELMIDVVATGLCHTDIIIRDQWFPTPLPAVLGHEGVGVVREVGAGVSKVRPGDLVVASYNYCGACRNCSRGSTMYCDAFWTHNFSGARADATSPVSMDGVPISANFFGQSTFARQAVVRERNVVPLGHPVDPAIAGPLGCGIQTGAGAVLNVIRPAAGSSIVVYGSGAVGLAAIMAARVAGCTTIIAVDLVPDRLALAEELGATHVIDGSSATVAKQVRKLTGGGVDYAVEATGSPKVLRTAMDALAQGGTCALVGAAASRTEASIDISTLLFGRKLVGVIEGESSPADFIPRLLELHLQGRFPFDRLITKYPFEEINRAVAASLDGTAIKPVLVMQ